MKRYIAAGLLALLLLITGCSTTAGNKNNNQEIADIISRYPNLEGHRYTLETVKRMVDGDTLETGSGNKVRLIGVNTPETVKPNSPVEFFAKEASEYSKTRLTGRKVYLFQDTGNTDRYGRWLRYVFIAGESEMFNEELLRKGYANTMTVPPNVMYAKRFVKLEREAREAGTGLWGTSGQESGDNTGASSSRPERTTEPSSANTESEVSVRCNGPVVKGNINSKGQKIYHVSGGRYYEQTKAEETFCSEKEAAAAGYRKSRS
ncbi:thermonuclease family protein [Paenibacillus gansuensis]|uniref:Thermonuclease family protein n=1 Tax=Paenibacillus gansuensis TaxID=306542 RepID=A0ABW5PCC9_9BACL